MYLMYLYKLEISLKVINTPARADPSPVIVIMYTEYRFHHLKILEVLTPQDFVVTMAMLCLTNTKNMSSTFIPQCHHVHHI